MIMMTTRRKMKVKGKKDRQSPGKKNGEEQGSEKEYLTPVSMKKIRAGGRPSVSIGPQ